MRKRSSGEKPVARIWLVQKVSASSRVACQGETLPCLTWGTQAQLSLPASRHEICSNSDSRIKVASSRALIHWASNASHNTSENRAEASTVSGVPGNHLRRRRSASSLAKALRDENP